MTAPTSISKNDRTAGFIRPEWMSDAQWSEVVAKLTDYWCDLLDGQARVSAGQRARLA